MESKIVQINIAPKGSLYEILIGNGILDDAGKWARQTLGGGSKKALLVSDRTVYGLYGEKSIARFAEAGFEVSKVIIDDGESSKSFDTAQHILENLSDFGISRTDAVIALGGGVVGDLAGFAGAIHLRGVPFLQIPTTLLAMIDSSVGGKTGVNSNKGKNQIGAFHHPRGVLIDTSVLETLDPREMTAGLCEAVKHGAIGGRPVFDPVADLVTQYPVSSFKALLADPSNFRFLLAEMIEIQVSFKARIVAGDNAESPDRSDPRSRKILNFGHTLAHALETVTGYRYFRHGEAVGYGILFAAELSKSLALCDQKDVQLLNDVVQNVGPLPALTDIDPTEVAKAFDLDKKNVQGSLQWVLLKGIGKPVIVSEESFPPKVMTRVLAECLAKWA